LNLRGGPHLLYRMNEFDVVIAGSGLGGLLSAVMLAREGLQVAVIEQNKQVGGCLQTFSFGKKVFDSCVHYISALDEGQTQHRIFSYAGIMPGLHFKKLDADGFDRIVFGDETIAYPYAQGMDHFKECLLPYFGNAGSDIDYYLSLLKDVTARFPLYNLQNGDPDEKRSVTGWTLDEVMGRLRTPRLREVLLGNSLLYAGDRHTSPFYLHALVNKSYIDSAYKCGGGSSRISKLLWQQLQEMGGVIFRNERVVRLEETGGRITAAVTASGNAYRARQFLVNVHPATALQWIDSKIIKPAYRKRIEQAGNSVSAFMLNILLAPGKVPCPNHNIYWNRSADSLAAVRYNAGEWPANYALYYNEDAQHPGYAESVTVLAYMHASETALWQHTRNITAEPGPRDAAYNDFKAQKTVQLLDCVRQRFPEIVLYAAGMQAATPLTFRDYMGSPDGSMYGIMTDVHQPERSQVPVRTRFPNLYLTGQNIGIHGVLGVSINAVAACGEILGLDYLLNKINKPFS